MIKQRDTKGRTASRPLEDRFVEGIREPFDVHNECWIWTGAKTGSGYGQIWLGAHRRQCVHRVAYEMFVGPIPDGYQIDHLCRNRACVRPDHLEAIPRKENASQWNLSKTHCPAGHPYDEENTYLRKDRPGHRECKICQRERSKKSLNRKRGLVQ